MKNAKEIPIEKLTPHPANPNTHPPHQIKELEKSLSEFSQVKNIVIWNNKILAGHGIVEAAKQGGLTTIKAVDVSEWPEEKAVKFMIADNRLPFLAVIDEEMMLSLFEDMVDPINIPGVDSKFLDDLGVNDIDIDILAEDGTLSGGQYGLAGSSTKVPFSVLGIGGMVDRDTMELFKKRLLSKGAEENQDNGEIIKMVLLEGLSG